MQDWLQLETFYNGLNGSLRASLDGASVKAFINNTYDWKDHPNLKWRGNQGSGNLNPNQQNPFYQPLHLQRS
ncbi:hypothetical protein EPI10_001338 [Gossypium australe]|uniref:Uncharacterized protein n=1 Tax=Gossypium australe TaxID=47621 RepID=A0A5B6VAR9_9ROSI|nr:hypothetical protein EPI10_001338 [Gossypium australe]